MKNSIERFNIYILIYISLLIFFGIFFLFSKHEVGNDSSISDWLINYSGGFVRRGIIGEISIYISKLLEIDLRDAIFFFQTVIFSSYYFLVYFFFKKIEFNRLVLLSVLSPIFILHPVAEIEILGRKELFIFFILILYYLLDVKNLLNQLIFKIILFPLAILIWEPVVFFFTYLLFIDLIFFKVTKFDKKCFIVIFSYIFSFITISTIYLNPISEQDFQLMKETLLNNYNEICYMSCSFVGNQLSNSFSELLSIQSKLIKIEYVIRYTLIIVIGFFPLGILLSISKLNFNYRKVIFLKKNHNLLIPFLILFIPSLLLFLLMYDWGRIVHISYTFTILTFFLLYKKKIISLNYESYFYDYIFKIKKSYFIFIFIIFCFGWNPKVVVSDDVASKPIYATPYKFYKYFIKN